MSPKWLPRYLVHLTGPPVQRSPSLLPFRIWHRVYTCQLQRVPLACLMKWFAEFRKIMPFLVVKRPSQLKHKINYSEIRTIKQRNLKKEVYLLLKCFPETGRATVSELCNPRNIRKSKHELKHKSEGSRNLHVVGLKTVTWRKWQTRASPKYRDTL
jgi:hypothetical protein